MTGVCVVTSVTKYLFFLLLLLPAPGRIYAYSTTRVVGHQPQTNDLYFTIAFKNRRFPYLPSSTVNKYHLHRSTPTTLSMALIYAPLSDLSQCLVLGVPTGEQYSTYWGRTSRERANAVFETCAVTFVGLFAAYFLSFVIGSSLATLFGMVAACWSILGPNWRAYQRNRDLLGGRRLVDPYYRRDDEDDLDYYVDEEDLYGAYYIASVKKVAVVESSLSPEDEEYDILDFHDYTMEQDENEQATGNPWMLRLLVEDKFGRNMQVHARMSEDYVNIREGMPCATILLSTDQNFHALSGLTDFYIPDALCCVGDYPYLDKFNFARILEEKGLLEVFDEEEQRWYKGENDKEGERANSSNSIEEEQVSDPETLVLQIL
jgi:hypothetical protein